MTNEREPIALILVDAGDGWRFDSQHASAASALDRTSEIDELTGRNVSWRIVRASEAAAARELIALAERVAEHFAGTDAPLGIMARDALAKAADAPEAR